MVHGGENYQKAEQLLLFGELKEVAKKFCSYCGGFIPCGCGHEEPQSV
jgi:hypothetical protein